MAISHGFNKTEAATSVSAPVSVNSGLQVVVGTAPVNLLTDPAAAVNTPLLASTFKEAAAAVGYSDDFAKYTLCDAVSASFQVMGVAPIVLINVLDPAKHTTALESKTVQVNDGVAEIEKTGILLDKLVVKKDTTALTADVDYTASFNDDGTVSIALVTGGKGDGATTLAVSGSILDPTKVTAADIVGGVNASTGKETGLEVVRQVFPAGHQLPRHLCRHEVLWRSNLVYDGRAWKVCTRKHWKGRSRNPRKNGHCNARSRQSDMANGKQHSGPEWTGCSCTDGVHLQPNKRTYNFGKRQK